MIDGGWLTLIRVSLNHLINLEDGWSRFGEIWLDVTSQNNAQDLGRVWLTVQTCSARYGLQEFWNKAKLVHKGSGIGKFTQNPQKSCSNPETHVLGVYFRTSYPCLLLFAFFTHRWCAFKCYQCYQSELLTFAIDVMPHTRRFANQGGFLGCPCVLCVEHQEWEIKYAWVWVGIAGSPWISHFLGNFVMLVWKSYVMFCYVMLCCVMSCWLIIAGLEKVHFTLLCCPAARHSQPNLLHQLRPEQLRSLYWMVQQVLGPEGSQHSGNDGHETLVWLFFFPCGCCMDDTCTYIKSLFAGCRR